MPRQFDPGTELGPRLRRVRLQRGLSARELARRLDCSASLISQVERGQSAPSVGMLYALASELSTSLDFLFGVDSGAHPRVAADAGTARGVVQRAAGRSHIDLASGVRWERLTPGPDDHVDFLEVVYEPGGHSTDSRRPLRHDGREYLLVVSGTLHASVGFDTCELHPGDSVAFDSSVPHQYWNATGDVVRVVSVVVHAHPGRA